MKKFASLILALAMMFTLCISAGAANPIENLGDTAEETVTLNVDANTTVKVYKVTVAWGNLEFTYNASANEGEWNAETHQYNANGEGAGWQAAAGQSVVSNGLSNTIKVFNHSNSAVKATITLDGATSATLTSGVDATLVNYSFTLGSAVNTNPSEASTVELLNGSPEFAPCGFATLTVVGTPDNLADNTYTKGISVAITAG